MEVFPALPALLSLDIKQVPTLSSEVQAYAKELLTEKAMNIGYMINTSVQVKKEKEKKTETVDLQAIPKLHTADSHESVQLPYFEESRSQQTKWRTSPTHPESESEKKHKMQ